MWIRTRSCSIPQRQGQKPLRDLFTLTFELHLTP
jgi:hypothetical protein